MSRTARRANYEAGELNLTAMIDVAFQLLAFFIITLHPVDVFTHLNIMRPAPQEPPPPIETPPTLSVLIYKDGTKDGFVLQGARVAYEELDRQLVRMAGISKDGSLVIKCTDNSSHNGLVRVLDLCNKAGLTKISVFSQ